MRLTHLKLAGFKSFVDPTTLHIHGQRVGVVGPNGCGKSNVMESVRWVLGESSAKEMRADAMDAVIFNGSGNRKPISRASVELVFDNSFGGASGEWSQYAEISVKRVIEREKGSTYYINNTVVRRRDVADLFLGTGLGGRAYAIIGQNTISRIVEARPEEMRVFLEEAAGISKYKERRRETELRLRDTRENLTRVEDILRELDKQIVRLQSQALVAQEYRRMQDTLSMTKAQIWLLMKRDASVAWEKAQRTVEKLVNVLEAQMASLRKSESALETLRQRHINSVGEVNSAQTSYYEVNVVVSNLENQVKNTADARERLQLQLQQLIAQLDKNTIQQGDIQSKLLTAQSDLLAANTSFSAAQSAVQLARDAVPMHLQHFQTTLAAYNTSQSAWLHAEQQLQLEQANASHICRSTAETSEQLKRLQQSYLALKIPENSALDAKQLQLTALEADIAALEAEITSSLQQEQALHAELKMHRDEAHNRQREFHVLEAEVCSLTKIQQAMREDNSQPALNGWLNGLSLNANARIWQAIRTTLGWETAFESILGGRLNAVTSNQRLPNADRPPAALTIAMMASTDANTKLQPSPYTSLYSLIENIEPDYKAVLYDWLMGVYLLEDDVDPISASQKLADGERLVNRQGDIYTKYSVTYFGEQSILHGVLERQARLMLLETQLPEMQRQFTQANSQVAQSESALQALRTNQHLQQQKLKVATQQVHQFNLSLQQLKQQKMNALQQQKMLQADCVLAEEKLQKLQAETVLKEKLIKDINANLSQLQTEKTTAETSKLTAEKGLNEARHQLQSIEHAHQEKGFNVKLIQNNINELNHKIQLLHEESDALKLRCNEVEATLAATKMEALKSNLDVALNKKQKCELDLASTRNTMAECELLLQQQERTRLEHEQQLHPMRDKLEVSRLSEQEARLHFEQCQAQLASSNIDEDLLQKHLTETMGEGPKVNDLEQKRNKLEFDVESLGAVNLAAIEELKTEQTRKQYLDSQCQDLTDASQTLEDAIRKIDRETRGRLQATFDEANRHFNELFTTLFGGGQARLELLGDEILDTGMQVFAQPPGKKNTTIHLLSGGEKALTALALVFALFRLNPAPFCLMDEVDAPLDDSNTERFCAMVKKMSERTQFLYVSHNKITMEMAQQLIGVTMQESGVSRIVDVDMEAAVRMVETLVS